MYSEKAADEKLNIKAFFENWKYKKQFALDNPSYFGADGLIVFTGCQGSGKTLSAVKYVCKLMEMYPHSKLVTNVMINDYPVIQYDDFLRDKYSKKLIQDYNDLSSIMKLSLYNDYLLVNRVFPFNNQDDLMRYSNLDEGVIFFIDEVQLYFNSLASKNINMDVMTEISQQRKQRKHIVCTSQVFGRLAKPLREQFNTVVVCRCYLGYLQRNVYLKQEDIETNEDYSHFTGKGSVKMFFHSVHDYHNYDTYFKIQENQFIPEEEKGVDIYERNIITSGE